MAVELNAQLIQKVEISPGLGMLRVTRSQGDLGEFRAGQFAVLGLPGSAPRCGLAEDEADEADLNKLIKRAYSIASSSVDREYLEFYITLVPSGALSPRLFALEPGDGVWLGPKFSGAFTLALDRLQNGRGNLAGRAEELRELGAKVKKQLPSDIIENATVKDQKSIADKTDEHCLDP